MGIRDLWEILSPVKQDVLAAEADLIKQTWTVDLAGWVCEADGVKAMQGTVTNAYLRNLFFRAKTLTKRGVKLIFVLDGAIPEMKLCTVYKRLGLQMPTGKPGTSRKRLNAKFNKCSELLDFLNIKWIKADGEAEAVCAALNYYGIADACITNDSDVLLYGAKTVFRQFTCAQKKITYSCYNVESIKEKLGLGRTHLIALGLLLGCDFCEQGVPGVGKVNALKLMALWKDENALEKMKKWNSSKKNLHTGDQQDLVELKICQKALMVDGFPSAEIIGEFLRDRRPTVEKFGRRKCICDLMSAAHVWKSVAFLEKQLKWHRDYALESILPYYTNEMLHQNVASTCKGIFLKRIVAGRTRDKALVYECEWQIDCEDEEAALQITFEDRDEVKKNFPLIVEAFWDAKDLKKKIKKTQKKKKDTKKTVDDLAESLQNIEISKPSVPVLISPPKKIDESSEWKEFESMSPSQFDTALRLCNDEFSDHEIPITISDSENEDDPIILSPLVSDHCSKSYNENDVGSSFDNSNDLFQTPISRKTDEKINKYTADNSESPVFMSLAQRLKCKGGTVTFPKLE